MADVLDLNEDFRDLLLALTEAGVDFLVVGAHALAAYGVVRATGDLDVLVRPAADNAERVLAGLRAFGAPIGAHGVTRDDFTRAGTVYQLGLPPRRIDILTSLTGMDFDTAARDAQSTKVGDLAFRVPSKLALIANKRATGRPKDLEDIRRLEHAGEDLPATLRRPGRLPGRAP